LLIISKINNFFLLNHNAQLVYIIYFEANGKQSTKKIIKLARKKLSEFIIQNQKEAV